MAISSPVVYSAGKSCRGRSDRWLATHWARANVRANAIVPGGVEGQQNDAFKRAYSNRIPLGRMARRSELVGAALFVASDPSLHGQIRYDRSKWLKLMAGALFFHFEGRQL